MTQRLAEMKWSATLKGASLKREHLSLQPDREYSDPVLDPLIRICKERSSGSDTERSCATHPPSYPTMHPFRIGATDRRAFIGKYAGLGLKPDRGRWRGDRHN